MRNVLICLASMLLFLSSCGSYAGMGAYTGSSIGSILGSAIGGLSGGARGADIGTIVGMAGGAVVGGAIGSAADRSRAQRYEGVRNDIASHKTDGLYSQYDSGYDLMGNGDDVIEFETGDVSPSFSSSVTSAYPSIEISNVRFADTSRDRVICRNETACLSFEVYNRGTSSVYNIQPMVVETTGNKHLIVSPGIRVEEIAPGRGIRYTAMVKADNKLKEGVAIFSVSVGQGNRIVSQAKDLQIKTSK